MSATKLDLEILKGATFSYVLRWEVGPIIYKDITAITADAPPRITATAHGIPHGWRVAITKCKGMKDLNAANDPPKSSDYFTASLFDANNIDLNSENTQGAKAYTGGGVIQYNTPNDLAGITGRMKIKDKVGGTILASTEAGDTPKNIITVTLDNTPKTITIGITAALTAGITWKKGVYDLELVLGAVVTRIVEGSVLVFEEVTT